MLTFEPSFFRLLQDERTTVLNHGRPDRAVHQNIDCYFARNPAFLRQQNAFGKSQHLHGEAEVRGDLHGQG